ncbi:DUF4124 domain-containing protein [Teredinibacter haidensis]|uniref:DUF4124 domain-containing protein n=1 Tax=Teredinibacter haidensis TaxID=2731755 RepID=UPI00094899C8|nr:DUF4124 domain-containing protein [Teredinibacter haidensis]
MASSFLHQFKLGFLVVGCAVVLVAGFQAGTSYAEDYYRWVGEDGVVHYGSTPPKGVEAIKVKTYGDQGTPAASTAEAEAKEIEEEANLPPEEIERRRKVAAKQQEICDEEQKRLEVLNRTGRIRMKQPDGSLRYMTQDEIQAEISTSKQVISDTCKQ